ncbi:MAG: VanZ family protein [Planctomycetaceae bacterium]|nr:VanZ family protein [Planctomycetaceae bacterium]
MISDRYKAQRQLCQILTGLYWGALSWLVLAPDPWWILGSSGRSVETTVDYTFADHIQHGSVYGLLAAMLAVSAVKTRWLTVLFCGGLLHAVLTEIAQYWIPLREFDLRDMSANVVGFLLFWIICQGVFLLFSGRSSQQVIGDLPAA